MSEEGKEVDMWGVGKEAIMGNGFWCMPRPSQFNLPSPPTPPYRQTWTWWRWETQKQQGSRWSGGMYNLNVCVCVCICVHHKGRHATATHTHRDTLVQLAIWKIGPPMHNWLLIHCILLKPSIYQALQFQRPWKQHFASTLQNTLKISSLYKCSLSLTANSYMSVKVAT